MLFNNYNHQLNKFLNIFFLLTFFLFNNKKNQIPSIIHPKVSIIIQIPNDLRIIYSCISSIIKSTPNIPYEIIISGSLLNTKISKIKKDFTNLVIINNHKENNFIDYNQFFQSSKGDYVIFLSYNTKVYANWLDFLINLIENDKKIGMVGSKIIYSNGLLEEAGSIAWNNGEFSNFAELKDQNLPEFN